MKKKFTDKGRMSMSELMRLDSAHRVSSAHQLRREKRVELAKNEILDYSRFEKLECQKRFHDLSVEEQEERIAYGD